MILLTSMSFKWFFIQNDWNSIMLAKLATPDLLKITEIISVYDVSNTISSCDSDYIVDVVMWPKFSNTSISELLKFQLVRDLTRKIFFFEGWSWFKLNNSGFVLSIAFKHQSSMANELKQIAKRFWGLIPPFREAAGENQ